MPSGKAESYTTPAGWQEKQGAMWCGDPSPDNKTQKQCKTTINSALSSAKMNSTLFGAMNDAFASPTPNPKILTLPDGSIQITVGEFRGTVSSMHLIEPKTHQLQDYWRKNHLRRHP
jgi:hypothetical protein